MVSLRSTVRLGCISALAAPRPQDHRSCGIHNQVRHGPVAQNNGSLHKACDSPYPPDGVLICLASFPHFRCHNGSVMVQFSTAIKRDRRSDLTRSSASDASAI